MKKGYETELYVKKLPSEKGKIKVEIRTKEEKPKESKEEKIFPIGIKDFSELKKTLQNESFEGTRLEILKSASEKNYFLSNQVYELLQIFNFDENKLEAAKTLYPRTVDKENFYKVYSAFTFSGSKEELKGWIKEYEEKHKKETKTHENGVEEENEEW